MHPRVFIPEKSKSPISIWYSSRKGVFSIINQIEIQTLGPNNPDGHQTVKKVLLLSIYKYRAELDETSHRFS
jgi:hypothetical protein